MYIYPQYCPNSFRGLRRDHVPKIRGVFSDLKLLYLSLVSLPPRYDQGIDSTKRRMVKT